MTTGTRGLMQGGHTQYLTACQSPSIYSVSKRFAEAELEQAPQGLAVRIAAGDAARQGARILVDWRIRVEDVADAERYRSILGQPRIVEQHGVVQVVAKEQVDDIERVDMSLRPRRQLDYIVAF